MNGKTPAQTLVLGEEFIIQYRLPGQRTDREARMQLTGYNPRTDAMVWNCRPAAGDQHFQLGWITAAHRVEQRPADRYINRKL